MSANTKILIVEDEPLIAADIDATLNDLGYIVDGIAHTAQEGIAFYSQTIRIWYFWTSLLELSKTDCR